MTELKSPALEPDNAAAPGEDMTDGEALLPSGTATLDEGDGVAPPDIGPAAEASIAADVGPAADASPVADAPVPLDVSPVTDDVTEAVDELTVAEAGTMAAIESAVDEAIAAGAGPSAYTESFTSGVAVMADVGTAAVEPPAVGATTAPEEPVAAEASMSADVGPAADAGPTAEAPVPVAASPVTQDLAAPEEPWTPDEPGTSHDPAATDEPGTAAEPAEVEAPVAAEWAAPSEPEAPVQQPAVAATVAVVVARALRAAGVRFAFTVPGESFLALMEAFVEVGIRVVTTRHENGAAFMAEAYGQLTGRPAVVIGTRAVGAANMAIGIHTARQDSTPMVVIVGQVSRRVRGREAFQEVDQVQSFGRLAKWATEVSDRSSVAVAVDDTLRHLRTGRPGPVMLSIPEDLLDETIPASGATPLRGRAPDLDPGAVREVLHLLAGAHRPVIIAGAGVLRARATNDLVEFAEMLEVPVIASWRRPDVFPNHHRLYLGMTGHGAAATVQSRIREADALLVLGSRLNEIASFDYAIPTRNQRWAHVDLEPRSAGHGLSAPTIAAAADARGFLRSAIERLKGGALEASLVDARASTNSADREAFEKASVVDSEPWDGPGVHPGRVVRTLAAVLPPDTILTTDAGNFASWAARGYQFRRPATFIGPTSGAMGYGFPAAIAAALARPNRASVALAGDGGFAMTMAELETAVRERARVVAIVFDNRRYGTIRAHQERRGRGSMGTDLGAIDFAGAAEAFGARGVRVEDDAGFEPALRDALAYSGPTVLHLTLDRRWLSIDHVLEA